MTGRLPLEQVYKYIARIKAAQVPHRVSLLHYCTLLIEDNSVVMHVNSIRIIYPRQLPIRVTPIYLLFVFIDLDKVLIYSIFPWILYKCEEK